MKRIADISSQEWRWTIIFSAILVILTLIPYLIAYLISQNVEGWRFMGILANPLDGATYLAKIGMGQRGFWLFELAHTPEVSNGVALQLFYIFLGQFSRLAGFSEIVTFHVARMVTSFVMFLSLYHFGATVWINLRARRLFFGIVGVGAGLGWLALLFLPDLQPVDLFVPEAIPMFSAFTNPHFPLAIALLALVASQYIVVFRPGYNALPNAQNGGVTVGAISIALSIIQPQAWLPLAVSLVAYLALQTIRNRQPPQRYELFWVMAMLLPALPVLFYTVTVVGVDPLYKIWNAQNVTPSGSPLNYALGFGLLWIVAAPGVLRAARRFERDGDRFMLIWMITNILLLYAPFNLQRRLVIGLILPIGYFAVRSMEDYWLYKIRRPARRMLAIILLLAVIIPSNALSMLLPLSAILAPQSGLENRILLPTDYADALGWIRANAERDAVTLALPSPSLWIPAYSASRVVYAHPFETVEYASKREWVRAYYEGKQCRLTTESFKIDYVIIGPNPTAADSANLTPSPESTACVAQLGNELARFGKVTIYAYSPRP
jgi:hypothetical protein